MAEVEELAEGAVAAERDIATLGRRGLGWMGVFTTELERREGNRVQAHLAIDVWLYARFNHMTVYG